MIEEALIGAYSSPEDAARFDVRTFELGAKTFRPCLCGSWIGLDLLDEDWSAGMRAHQDTRSHRQWRARNGL